MISDSSLADARAVEMTLSRQEAALVIDAIKVLRNCRKYAFREDHGDDSDPSLAALEELAARVRATLELK